MKSPHICVSLKIITLLLVDIFSCMERSHLLQRRTNSSNTWNIAVKNLKHLHIATVKKETSVKLVKEKLKLRWLSKSSWVDPAGETDLQKFTEPHNHNITRQPECWEMLFGECTGEVIFSGLSTDLLNDRYLFSLYKCTIRSLLSHFNFSVL